MEEKPNQKLEVISASSTKELKVLFSEKKLCRDDIITIIKDGEYFRLFYAK